MPPGARGLLFSSPPLAVRSAPGIRFVGTTAVRQGRPDPTAPRPQDCRRGARYNGGEAGTGRAAHIFAREAERAAMQSIQDFYIAPGVVVTGDVVLSPGVNIWYGSVIRGDLARITLA